MLAACIAYFQYQQQCIFFAMCALDTTSTRAPCSFLYYVSCNVCLGFLQLTHCKGLHFYCIALHGGNINCKAVLLIGVYRCTDGDKPSRAYHKQLTDK